MDAFPQVVEAMSNLSGRFHPILVTIALLQPEARRKVIVFFIPINAWFSQVSQQIKLNPNNAMNNPPLVQPSDGTTVLTSMDIRRLTWGIRHMRSIFHMKPLRNHWSTELLPGKNLTDDALQQWVCLCFHAFVP